MPPLSENNAARRRADNFTGARWMMISALGATVLTVAVREMGESFDSRMIAFLRSGFGVLVLSPWLLSPNWRQIRVTRPWLHLLRGGLMGGALNFGFYAITALPLTTATVLFFLAPVFTTALAGPVLGEKVGPRRWTAVAAGFLGAAIILRPGFSELRIGMVLAIASSACFAGSLLIVRRVAQTDGSRSLFITTTVLSALITLPLALPVWETPSTTSVWFWIAALVLSSNLRTYADIRAYAVGEAGFLAPFSYIRLIFIALAGWLLFREGFDVWTLCGGGVIIASTLYIAHREHVLNRSVSGPEA